LTGIYNLDPAIFPADFLFHLMGNYRSISKANCLLSSLPKVNPNMIVL